MQNIYTIPLLNDLHNHFPEILYARPDRFRNVADLLEYIRDVAHTSPYQRGLHDYTLNRPNQWEILNDTPDRVYIPISRQNVQNGSNGSNESNGSNGSTISIISRLINGIIGNMDDLENVIVQPTTEQVSNATNVYHVNVLQDDICIICQDNINSGEVRRITHCNHYFHNICISTWFQEHVYCPTCRYDIRT